jgi:hypothetical protein
MREELSKILIKHGCSTNQAMINEIMVLWELDRKLYKEALVRKVKEGKKDKTFFKVYREDFNEAKDEDIAIINKVLG